MYFFLIPTFVHILESAIHLLGFPVFFVLAWLFQNVVVRTKFDIYVFIYFAFFFMQIIFQYLELSIMSCFFKIIISNISRDKTNPFAPVQLTCKT